MNTLSSLLMFIGTKIGNMTDNFYPVGSYYETSDTNFNPNESWGGTWVLEAEGLVHISAGSTYTIGSTGGEATHKLTTTEMPSHNHTYTYAVRNSFEESGSGTTHYGVSSYSTQYTGSSGGNLPHNNMQPYTAVNRWHRTA